MARTMLFLFAVLLVTPLAAAQGGEDGSEWEYELEVSSAEAYLEMRSESELGERAVYFEYARDEARVEFAYEAEDEVTDSGSEAAMEVQFHQLIEYEDDDGDGQYDDGETIASAYSLNEDDEEFLTNDAQATSWSRVERSSVTSDDGVGGSKFSSTADVGGGSLRFDFFVFGDEASLGPASLEPTQIKLDIIINDYPYQSDSSALALFLESEAEAEVEEGGGASDEEGVRADLGAQSLVFTWKDFAAVDGTDQDVKTTILQGSTSQSGTEYAHEKLIVFSYARGDEIIHDPTLGVSSGLASIGIPNVGITLTAIGTLGLAAALRRP